MSDENNENGKSFKDAASKYVPSKDAWKDAGKYVADKVVTVASVIAGIAAYTWLAARGQEK